MGISALRRHDLLQQTTGWAGQWRGPVGHQNHWLEETARVIAYRCASWQLEGGAEETLGRAEVSFLPVDGARQSPGESKEDKITKYH
ncbi:hypothetical protein HJFPF1_01071 [Paramyrothecium foliicola]|nr:hypothetical protein HJFPF1_01071 [Paramyrothecium foliicola]